MSAMQVTDEIIDSGRRAWNQLESIFAKNPDYFEPDSTEFAIFYEQLVSHLLEEETEA